MVILLKEGCGGVYDLKIGLYIIPSLYEIKAINVQLSHGLDAKLEAMKYFY